MRRRPTGLAVLVTAVVCLGIYLSVSPSQPAPRPSLVQQVSVIGLTVSDADRAARFYAEVLRFERVADTEVAGQAYEQFVGLPAARARIVRMKLGREFIELVEFHTPRGRAVPADSRSNDRWFQHIAIVVSDMDQAYAWVQRHHVAHVSPAPQHLPDWNPNAGGIRAFYFRDPDGHPLELIAFPPDKGPGRWHTAADSVFLGIDHTAIAVGDTEASLRFYRDTLGFRVAGTSENWGPEQERLNDVAGARLRITTLRAPSGPGVELLEYLAPRDGRPAPADLLASDLVHTYTALVVEHTTAVARLLAGTPLLSRPPVALSLPRESVGFANGFTLRDPDGHPLQIRSP